MDATATNLDQELALAAACASVQAYKAYLAGAAFAPDPLQFITPPDGWTYKELWLGQDVFKKEPVHPLVLFGLVFVSAADPSRVLFAFRGTEGIAEWIDDLKVAERSFQPFTPGNGPAVPAAVRIEDGFAEIYDSMQKSLFDLVDALAPSQVTITGHSLGSSLCELFALDLAISRPKVPAATLNFAAPRTGNAAFAAFYDSLTSGMGNPTRRVVNVEDVVPCVPPELLGYQQVGEAFYLCFKEVGIVPNLGLRHSMELYYQALCRTLGATGCDCALRGVPWKVDFCFPNPKAECEPLRGLLERFAGSLREAF